MSIETTRRLGRTAAIGLLALAATWAGTAGAVMLVEIDLHAASRPIGPSAPADGKKQTFAVPGGPGTLTMTFTEDAYVGGPGGFEINPVDLSNDKLGFGGRCDYTPRDPVRGQPYRVQCTWLHDFSKKSWYAALGGRVDWPNRRQIGSNMSLRLEFVPGERGPAAQDASPAAPAPPPAPPAPPPAAPPPPVAPAPPPTVAPAPPPPTAAPAPPPTTPSPPPTAPGPAPVTPPPPVAPPPSPTGLPSGTDRYDSTSFTAGDPFSGGEWRNARNGSASAIRDLAQPVCVTGLRIASAGTDVDTVGSTIEIVLHAPDGTARTVLKIEGAAIDRDFSPGGRATAVPAQSRTFEPVATSRVEVRMTGHGWFLMRGLVFDVVPCR